MAGFLVIAMVAAGITMVPVKVDATGTTTIPETVDYDDTLEIADYWKTRTAPTKEGYVFGGWYTKTVTGEVPSYTPLKEATLKEVKDLATLENVCAKFVPSYVLSVRAQLQKETESEETRGTSTYLRVISAVDSTDYKNVGFDILFNKKTLFADEEQEKTVITTVYENIANDEGSINATALFGAPATHFSVLRIDEIKERHYEKVIYVTPYWTTMDGTKVEGLAKYVRVMDGYTTNQYISVPVNLLTGDAIAAGAIQMTYDYKTLKYVGYDSGVLLPEMEANVDETNGIIKFVGNATITDNTATAVEPESDIYANVWFQKIPNTTAPAHWEFKMDNENAVFCNWAEEDITNVKAWDARY